MQKNLFLLLSWLHEICEGFDHLFAQWCINPEAYIFKFPTDFVR